MQLLQVGEPDAREMVKTQDRARAALVRAHGHRDIDDPLLYDAVWNTETVPFDVITGSILELVKQRTRNPAAASGSSPAQAQARAEPDDLPRRNVLCAHRAQGGWHDDHGQ